MRTWLWTLIVSVFCTMTMACSEDAPKSEPSSAFRECRPKVQADAACEESSQCGSGFWCSEGVCEEGAASGLPCSDGIWCASGLACSFPDFVCGPTPGIGEPCALTEFGPSFCGEALGCVGGTCEALPGEGEPCTTDSRCREPWGCSFEREGSFCRARVGSGEDCENDQICEAETYCNYRENRCAPVFALGAECSLGNECGRSRACLPSGSKFICGELPGSGQPCIDACSEGLECVLVEPD